MSIVAFAIVVIVAALLNAGSPSNSSGGMRPSGEPCETQDECPRQCVKKDDARYGICR